jgi:hypothetical protein
MLIRITFFPELYSHTALRLTASTGVCTMSQERAQSFGPHADACNELVVRKRQSCWKSQLPSQQNGTATCEA